MTRKPAPRAQAHSAVALFIANLTILIALVAFVPLNGVGQSSGRSPHPGNRLQAKGSVIGSSQPSSPLFLPTVAYDTGAPNTIAVAVSDVNGDGKPDLVVANECANPTCATSSVGVLIGNGDGTFQPVMTYGPVGYLVVALAVADLNGDGKPDVIMANFLSSTVTTLLGNGDGTFRPGATYGSGGIWAQAVTVADINGDGKPDLLVANAAGNYVNGNPSTRTVSVLLGNGDGTFQAAITYDSGGTDVSLMAVADVNRDGRLDLIVANRCGGGDCANQGSVAVLLGNGDGTFQAPATYSSGGYLTGWVAVADINGDRKLDVIVTNCTSVGPTPPAGSADCPNGNGVIGVLLGNGDGSFQPARTYNSGGVSASALVVADFDGGGKADLALLTNIQSKTLAVLLGNGDGTFQPATAYDSGGAYSAAVAVADLNGDHRPDLVVANQLSSCSYCAIGSVGVLLNNAPLDTTPPLITISATPKVLWPPNGRMLPVTVSGTITDAGSGVNVNSAAYAVKDEYGKVQPMGRIALGPGGNYSFSVLLQASRLGGDLDGRRYTIFVRAKDNAGNGGSKTSVVTVPHDQGH